MPADAADFQVEREVLQRRVFPPIGELCRAEGVRFLPIDLRRAVSQAIGTTHRPRKAPPPPFPGGGGGFAARPRGSGARRHQRERR